ncbi:MAG TPA: glycosyltransferase family 4 protein [Vicinamibacteria bacterium]|nr:glycosyltransferase family 4 protein [Vicinamibacteria bacterium]
MSLPRRILVVTSGALFVRGGHMVIAEQTAAALRRAGFLSDVMVTPQNRFGRQLSAYASTWLTDVGETADGHAVDQVITLRFPSYAVRHPRHVCWLNHRMREYYDLWEHFTRGMGRRLLYKERVRRRLFHALDRYLLTRNVGRLVAQSRTIQARLQRFGRIPSQVLYPPAPERPYRTDEYGDYVFAVSRLTPLKRLGLLVEAAALMKERTLRIRIAGHGEEEARLRERIAALGLEDRVELLGAVDEDELVGHYARCRAVAFAPWNEDYGFVTLEAFRSGKAVLTTRDSGGPAELVADEVTGFVADPEPAALAARLDELARDRGRAERMGQAARAASAEHTWARAVDALVAGTGF